MFFVHLYVLTSVCASRHWTGRRHSRPPCCRLLFTPLAIGKQSIVMIVSLCVCLSVHGHIFGTTRPIFAKFFMHVTHGRGLVLLWRRSNILRISVFMDNVIVAHKLRLLDVAARLRQWGSHAALGLAHRNTRCRQWTLRTTSCSQGLIVRNGHVEYLWHHVCT